MGLPVTAHWAPVDFANCVAIAKIQQPLRHLLDVNPCHLVILKVVQVKEDEVYTPHLLMNSVNFVKSSGLCTLSPASKCDSNEHLSTWSPMFSHFTYSRM